MRKYGKRQSYHKEGLGRLFKSISNSIHRKALVESDEHNFYPEVLRKHLPDCLHETHKSVVGCVTGQGELKKTQNDPLFNINHTCAYLRANINRLVRRTWCTTKDPAMLKNHLDICIDYFNHTYLNLPAFKQ